MPQNSIFPILLPTNRNGSHSRKPSSTRKLHVGIRILAGEDSSGRFSLLIMVSLVFLSSFLLLSPEHV